MIRTISAARAALLFVAVMALSACEDRDPAAGGPEAAPAPTVEVARPLSREVTEWDEFTGRLAAVDQVDIRSRVGGYLESVHFKEGAIVTRGDLLYVIDPKPYEATLRRRKAEVEQARATLRQAKADFERSQELVRTKAIPGEVHERRAAAFATAEAALDAAEAEMDLAELDVAYTHIRAPVSGRIGRTRVTPGNLVDGGQATSTVLTTLLSMDPIHFYFTGTEKERLRYLRLDEAGRRPNSARFANAVQLKLSDEADFLHQGVMDFVDNRVDEATGTITGRAIFDNPDHILVPGMFARIKLKGEGPYPALLVPDEAVLSDQTEQIVYVLDADNNARRRAVTTGVKAYGLRVIRKGLVPQDRVIVNGLSRVRPGTMVTPQLVTLTASEDQNAPVEEADQP